MTDKMRMTPDDAFPEHLEKMSSNDLQVLDSQIQRQLDHEIDSNGESDRETEFRHEEVDQEFITRDKQKTGSCEPLDSPAVKVSGYQPGSFSI